MNPLGFDKRGAYALPVEEGSAAEQAAAILPDSRVVAAFHHVSAVLCWTPRSKVDLDVLVLGDDREATDVVRALAARIPGVREFTAGAAQRPPGGGVHRQPDFDQPPLQGPRGYPHHRHLKEDLYGSGPVPTATGGQGHWVYTG